MLLSSLWSMRYMGGQTVVSPTHWITQNLVGALDNVV